MPCVYLKWRARPFSLLANSQKVVEDYVKFAEISVQFFVVVSHKRGELCDYFFKLMSFHLKIGCSLFY